MVSKLQNLPTLWQSEWLVHCLLLEEENDDDEVVVVVVVGGVGLTKAMAGLGCC